MPPTSRSTGKSRAWKPNAPPGSMAARIHAMPSGVDVSRALMAAVISMSPSLWARCSSASSRSFGSNSSYLTSRPSLRHGGDVGHAAGGVAADGPVLEDAVAGLAVERGPGRVVGAAPRDLGLDLR